MSQAADGGPAFPVTPDANRNGEVAWHLPGMTLRDYFAGQAMAGLIGAPIDAEALTNDEKSMRRAQLLTKWAYDYADAMLTAREAS